MNVGVNLNVNLKLRIIKQTRTTTATNTVAKENDVVFIKNTQENASNA